MELSDFSHYLNISYKSFHKRPNSNNRWFNLSDKYERYIYNKCMISLAKYAGDMVGYEVPYINNYKFFLDDPDYTRSSNETVNKINIQDYILHCLDVPVTKNDYYWVNQQEDFQKAMIKTKINYKNCYPAFSIAQSVMADYTYENETISFEYIYELYVVLITEYLSRRPSLELSSPLPENTAISLNSKNIFTPYEGYITTHCFFEKYMRTEEQRNTDYPFVYNCKSAEKRYSYSEACGLLYNSECESDVYRVIENTLKKIYNNIGLERTDSRLSQEDMAMYVIWKMLFRSSDSTLDDYLKFNKTVQENINPTLIHNSYSIENLNDNNTLCENRWSDDNSAAVYESLIKCSVAENYESINLTEIWWDILNRATVIFKNGVITGYLTEKLVQAEHTIPEDIEEKVGILSEYKYIRDLYDFVTGLSTMVNVYGDIARAYPKFRKGCHPCAYEWTVPMNFRDITPEFIKDNELWKLLCEVEPETKREIYKLEESIIKSLPIISSSIDTICQNKTYSLRQHCATIWLYKNGGDIEITFPKSYHKRTNLPNTLSAIMKCNDDNRKSNTNMWYNLISISNFVEAYRQFMVDPEAYKHTLKINLTAYTELYDYIHYNFVQKNKSASYTLKALEYILSTTTDLL